MQPWIQLFVNTFTDPRSVARHIMGLRLPLTALWMFAMLTIVVNGMLLAVSNLLVPPPDNVPVILRGPLIVVVLGALGFVLSIFVTDRIARFFSKVNGYADLLALLAWVQAVHVTASLIVSVLGIISVDLAVLLALVLLFAMAWISAVFVDEAYRLGSAWGAVLILLATGLIVIALIMVVIMVLPFDLLGVSEQMGTL